MNHWSIRSQYGYGVARLQLPAALPRPQDRGLVDGARQKWRSLSPLQRRRWLQYAMTAVAFRVSILVILYLFWKTIPVQQEELFEVIEMTWIEEVAPPLPEVKEVVEKPPPLEKVAAEEEPLLEPTRMEPQRVRRRPQVIAMDPLPRSPQPVVMPVVPRIELAPVAESFEGPRPEAADALPIPVFASVRPISLAGARLAPALPFSDRSLTPGELRLPSVSAPRLAFPSSRQDLNGEVNSVPWPSAATAERPGFPLDGTAPRGLTGVEAVPLSSLPSCFSDAEEESLKQKVLATVEVQVECNSQAGIWRFLQTRNLNAFLINVKRDPGRPQGNRCDELRLALECLRGTQSKEILR
jgi:hypothetical protein